jgi:hypothetical protein
MYAVSRRKAFKSPREYDGEERSPWDRRRWRGKSKIKQGMREKGTGERCQEYYLLSWNWRAREAGFLEP